jgi:hypothetical protein
MTDEYLNGKHEEVSSHYFFQDICLYQNFPNCEASPRAALLVLWCRGDIYFEINIGAR